MREKKEYLTSRRQQLHYKNQQMTMALAMALISVVVLLVMTGANALPTNNVTSIQKNLNSNDVATDIETLRKHFKLAFSTPRATDEEKQKTRRKVLAAFQEYGLDSAEHTFRIKNGREGVNIIGILPGKNRLAGKQDSILMVSSHYDTNENGPGVVDNGSGSVAVLELARLIHEAKVHLDHTIIFVMFDMEEVGTQGSEYFVREWLIPKELSHTNTRFLGLYNLDMVMTYDPTPGSQMIPTDLQESCPEEIQDLKDSGSRGDFIAAISRREIDEELSKNFVAEWPRTEGSKKYKLRKFDPSVITGNTWNSDHTEFWCPNVDLDSFSTPLRAIYLRDMGDLRAVYRRCYHEPCDDEHFLTDDNLGLLKTVVDTMFRVFVYSPPAPLINWESIRIPKCPS